MMYNEEGKMTNNIELLALIADVGVELSEHLVSLALEFHDREDLVYVRIPLQAISQYFCSTSLNVCGDEFCHE